MGLEYKNRSGGGRVINDITTISDTLEHHYGLSYDYDSELLCIVVDGAIALSKTVEIGAFASGSLCYIGASISVDGEEQINGTIRDARISNTAHTADKMIADQQLGHLPVESDTTCYMSLDRTLFAEGSAM